MYEIILYIWYKFMQRVGVLCFLFFFLLEIYVAVNIPDSQHYKDNCQSKKKKMLLNAGIWTHRLHSSSSLCSRIGRAPEGCSAGLCPGARMRAPCSRAPTWPTMYTQCEYIDYYFEPLRFSGLQNHNLTYLFGMADNINERIFLFDDPPSPLQLS